MKATRLEKYLPPSFLFPSPPPPPFFPPVVSDLSQSLTLPSSPLHLQSPPYPSFSLHRPLCVPFPSAPSTPLSLFLYSSLPTPPLPFPLPRAYLSPSSSLAFTLSLSLSLKVPYLHAHPTSLSPQLLSVTFLLSCFHPLSLSLFL